MVAKRMEPSVGKDMQVKREKQEKLEEASEKAWKKYRKLAGSDDLDAIMAASDENDAAQKALRDHMNSK